MRLFGGRRMRKVEIVGEIKVGPNLVQHVLPQFENEVAESRTEEKRRLLGHFFTNLDGNVHAIKGDMPPVMAAALIARFSRAEDVDVSELFWNEFVLNPDLGTAIISRYSQEEGVDNVLAQKHARDMIKRVIDRFGDDSVREQASGYIVVDKEASVLASQEIFLHPLVTGIEASTRYIPWGERDSNGNFRYIRPEAIMNSGYGEIYEFAMDALFETYQELWQPVLDHVVAKKPKPEEESDAAYEQAIRGRVCDNLRKLLPLGVKTRFGIHANFRTFSEVIMNLRASDNLEVRNLADEIATQLKEINPEFVAVVDSQHAPKWTKYQEDAKALIGKFSNRRENGISDQDQRVEIEVLNEDPVLDLAKGIIELKNPSLGKDEITRLAYQKI